MAAAEPGGRSARDHWYESVGLRPQPVAVDKVTLSGALSGVELPEPFRPTSVEGLETKDGSVKTVTGSVAPAGKSMPMAAVGSCAPQLDTPTSACPEKILVAEWPFESVTVSCGSYSPARSGTKLA